MKDLVIGINGVQGTFYTITIKGYQNLIPLVRWVNTFMGMNRDDMLCNVTDTFVQPVDNCVVMVIQMDKVEFHHASSDAGRIATEPAVQRLKKRVD